MLYTLKIKLHPSAKQRFDILETMERFNSACNFISRFAFEHKIFAKFKIQQEIYYQVRKQFKISAQMAVRAIGKVAETDGKYYSGAAVKNIRKRNFKLRQKLQSKGTKRGIALEDLTGIRKRTAERKTVNKTVRQELSAWAFYQLRQFIQYKAKAAGVW